LGNNFGHFRSGANKQTVSNDPLAQGDPFSRNPYRTDSGFGCQEGEQTATERDFGRFGSGLGVLRLIIVIFNCIMATTPP
jgi:hypothetical protein